MWSSCNEMPPYHTRTSKPAAILTIVIVCPALMYDFLSASIHIMIMSPWQFWQYSLGCWQNTALHERWLQKGFHVPWCFNSILSQSGCSLVLQSKAAFQMHCRRSKWVKFLQKGKKRCSVPFIKNDKTILMFYRTNKSQQLKIWIIWESNLQYRSNKTELELNLTKWIMAEILTSYHFHII